MRKILLKESELINLIETAMDLDIYSQNMTTPTGRPTEDAEETVEEIIEYLKELISMMKGGKEVSTPLRQSIYKNLDDIKNTYQNIKYGK